MKVTTSHRTWHQGSLLGTIPGNDPRTKIFTNNPGYSLQARGGEEDAGRIQGRARQGRTQVPETSPLRLSRSVRAPLRKKVRNEGSDRSEAAAAVPGSRAPSAPAHRFGRAHGTSLAPPTPTRVSAGTVAPPPGPRRRVPLAHRAAVPRAPERVPRPAPTGALPPPPPRSLPPAGQEVCAAAGDSAEGPRRLPESADPEAAAAAKGGPAEPKASASGEGERQGAGDQPETRSVCSSRSSSSGGGDQRAGHQHQHHQPICKICFQGAEQGELLNPCRCDGSVRYTHQLCLLKWISERGSWTCELCCYRYHVIAIKMKQPCQWQSISITLVEKVQMIAVILGSLFLIASVTWLLWSAFSPYAVWQRKDILFQICYGMYGFMDLVCIGLIVHEGAAVYRVFKRWRAVNLHWDVLNYDKATDIEESSRGESSTSRTLWLPLTALRNRNLVHPTQLTSPRFQCGYVLLHLFNRMRPHEDLSEDNSSGEVVMRVTSV
uniref:RING-type E3 ubiquitin transferase n=1 Tax=Prolemur simus TaxID=1328070 RepID=A0A8C9A0A6_PROSS